MAERVSRVLPHVAERLVVRPHPVSADAIPRIPRRPVILCPVLFSPFKGMTERLTDVVRAMDEVVDSSVRLLVTATDVIHSWAMPPFAVKLDGEPGRVNETWFRITKEGTFYGQCSEICGVHHAYMPITIEAVSKEKFKEWAAQAKTKFAAVDQPAAAPAATSQAAPAVTPAGSPTPGSAAIGQAKLAEAPAN